MYGLNGARKEIYESYMKVVNELMSAIHFGTMYNENLPHLSYIFCNPEHLGGDLKTMLLYKNG